MDVRKSWLPIRNWLHTVEVQYPFLWVDYNYEDKPGKETQNLHPMAYKKPGLFMVHPVLHPIVTREWRKTCTAVMKLEA